MNRPIRPKLVALDEDITLLRTIAEIAAPHFETIRVRDAVRAMATCQEDPDVRAFVSAHAIYAPTGVSVFDFLRERCPQIRRVMLTDYANLTLIVNGLHSGGIQYLAHKPLKHAELAAVIGALATAQAQINLPPNYAPSSALSA